MTCPEPLPDTWYSRELPVLREVARLAELGDIDVSVDVLAQALNMPQPVIGRAGTLLEEDGYLADTSTAFGTGLVRFGRVTPKGRREVGQWPSPDIAADRLLAALEAAVTNAPTEEDRSKARRVLDAFTSAGRDLLVDVAGGVVTGQISGG